MGISPLARIHIALFCGARDWTDPKPVQKQIDRLIKIHGVSRLLILEGGAPGLDQIAGYLGRSSNVHVSEIKALWETRHRSAGPQRNIMMAALRPDEVVAFHPDIKKSKGTKDMVRIAESLGIATRLVDK